MGVLRIKKMSLARPRLRRRKLFAHKQSFRLGGGPMRSAWLSTPGTLCFRLGEFHGYYNSDNQWVQI